MPQFLYKAKDSNGQPVEGVIDAEGKAAVVARLQQMGYFPIRIDQGARKGGKVVAAKPAKANGSTKGLRLAKFGSAKDTNGTGAAAKQAPAKAAATPSAPAAAPSSSRGQGFFSRSRIKTADVAAFNRQLADLLTAGVALVKALTILARQTSNERLQEIIEEVNHDVQEGDTFADALAKHPAVFSKLYIAMVRSGEAGGMLGDVLERLADFSEQEEQLRGRIKSALAYPVVMVIAGGAAVVVMFTYVVPKIVSTFQELNQTLPAITRLLIGMSEFAQGYWYVALAVGGLAWFLGWRFVTSPEGRKKWHRTQLRLPVMGDLVRKREVARFSRTLGSLLKNGVPILSALKITEEVVDNELVKAEVLKVTEEIKQGAGVAQPLRASAVFPPVTVNMMAVGEETGQLERVLLRISESFEIEVDRKVKTLTALLEPLIIVAMGLVVGFIVIAMLLPIFSLDPTGASG